MQSTTYHLTITLPDGKYARATVIYLQPQAARWREQTMRVHITCGEWIEPYWHPASYAAGNQITRGQFIPHTYKLGDAHGWMYEGTFERDA